MQSPRNRVATRTSTRPPPCPTSAPCPYRTLGCKQSPRNRVATRTSTRPPPCPTSAPCPYRTLGCKSLHGYDYPIRSSTFIRLSHLVDCLQTIHTSPGVLSTPHFVPWRKVTGRCLTP